MPFGPYRDFEHCVAENQDKRDPDAFCGAIQEQVEGGKSFEYAKAYANSLFSADVITPPQGKALPSVPMIEGKTYTFYTSGLSTSTEIDKKGHIKYFVHGYISTSDIDLVDDMVMPEAIEGMFMQTQDRNIKVDVEHEIIDGESGQIRNIIPVARIVESRKDDVGLFVKALMNTAIKRFDEVWESLEGKFLDAFSITFRVRDATNKVINGIETRLIHALDLINVAFTGNPINPQASITDVFTKANREWVGHGIVTGAKNRLTEGKQMGDQTDEEKKADAEAKAHADAQAKIDADAKAVADKEAAEQVAAEEKAKAEAKAIVDLKAELKAVQLRNAELVGELKALKEHPILKGAGPTEVAPPAADPNVAANPVNAKAINPLDAC